MSARDDYPHLASLIRGDEYIGHRGEARAALDEIDRLRADVAIVDARRLAWQCRAERAERGAP